MTARALFTSVVMAGIHWQDGGDSRLIRKGAEVSGCNFVYTITIIRKRGVLTLYVDVFGRFVSFGWNLLTYVKHAKTVTGSRSQYLGREEN